jgi:hypothetical protein
MLKNFVNRDALENRKNIETLVIYSTLADVPKVRLVLTSYPAPLPQLNSTTMT